MKGPNLGDPSTLREVKGQQVLLLTANSVNSVNLRRSTPRLSLLEARSLHNRGVSSPRSSVGEGLGFYRLPGLRRPGMILPTSLVYLSTLPSLPFWKSEDRRVGHAL